MQYFITDLQGDAGIPGTDGEKGQKGDNCTTGPKGEPGDSIKGTQERLIKLYLMPTTR